MNALTIHLYLAQPVLAGKPQSGEANSNQSYLYIPGSMLRGALATRYTSGGRVDLASGDEFSNLFLNGKVRYLNAYPLSREDNRRMLPTPFSWFVKKGEENNLDEPVYDFLETVPEQDVSYQPPSESFFWPNDESVKLFEPEVDITVHNASSDRNRKIAGSSQVYRYEALAAGQTFVAVVISDDYAQLQKIQALLKENDLVLGGSVTGGYGRVSIANRPLVIDPDWQGEVPPTVTGVDKETPVTLTCLSDVIYRSPDGAPNFDLTDPAGESPTAVFRQTSLVGGFNRKWGLPLVQDRVIAAGSVFVFPAYCRAALEAQVERGIGERLAEGFGRFALDLQHQSVLKRSKVPRTGVEQLPCPGQLSDESQRYASLIAQRQLRHELDRWLTERITNLAANSEAFQYLPKPAQLSRARLAARAAWQTGDLLLIQKHFNGLSDLSQRSWKNANLRGDPLKDWILKRAAEPSKWEQMHVKTVSFAGVKAELTDEMRSKTIARLIEGVLQMAVRYAKQQEDNNG